MIRVLVVIFTIVISGCAMISRDISNSKRVIESGWKKGLNYQAVQPMFLVNDKNNGRYYVSRSNADHLPVNWAHQCGSTFLPKRISEYESNPEKWPHIERILPIGTKIRFDKAFHIGGLSGYFYGGLSSLTITGTLLADVQLSVNLECISIADSESQLFLRDTSWLKE